jgi:hypothetical protein
MVKDARVSDLCRLYTCEWLSASIVWKGARAPITMCSASGRTGGNFHGNMATTELGSPAKRVRCSGRDLLCKRLAVPLLNEAKNRALVRIT